MSTAKPFLRWIGGKQKNVRQFARFLPAQARKYFYIEPFVGSGAMLFFLRPEISLIADINAHLINCYKTIKFDVNGLLLHLAVHEKNDKEEYYYTVRDKFNKKAKTEYPRADMERASDFIYLNTRCFNGLYRENASGEMNAPFARDLKGLKRIYNEKLYHDINSFLTKYDVKIANVSFVDLAAALEEEGIYREKGRRFFYFIDPPYHPIDETSNFASYVSGKWNESMTEQLKRFADDIHEKGDLFYICNHAVDFIRDLFSDYHQIEHAVSRSVSCDAQNRKPVDEIVVTNYKLAGLF